MHLPSRPLGTFYSSAPQLASILHEKSRYINQKEHHGWGRPETTRLWYWTPQAKELEVLSPGKPDELEDFEDACCLLTERSV